jgi:hypothetical protein
MTKHEINLIEQLIDWNVILNLSLAVGNEYRKGDIKKKINQIKKELED